MDEQRGAQLAEDTGGFPGLLKMVVQQQVSLASAAAIWARVEAGLPEMTPDVVMGHDQAYLLSLGLSRPKARYAHAIAHATADAAYSGQWETLTGRLAEGLAADFVVLDQDPFALGDDALLTARVVQTEVAGKGARR